MTNYHSSFVLKHLWILPFIYNGILQFKMRILYGPFYSAPCSKFLHSSNSESSMGSRKTPTPLTSCSVASARVPCSYCSSLSIMGSKSTCRHGALGSHRACLVHIVVPDPSWGSRSTCKHGALGSQFQNLLRNIFCVRVELLLPCLFIQKYCPVVCE